MRYLLISLFIFGSSAFAANAKIEVDATAGNANGVGTSNLVTSELDPELDGTFVPGAIRCLSDGSGICTETIDEASLPVNVKLTATPDADSVFVKWKDGECGPSSDPICSFTAIAAMEAAEKAKFDYAAKLSVEVLGSYSGNNVTDDSSPLGIDCYEGSGDCEENYPQGKVVVLTATADSASVIGFTGWGDPSLCDKPNTHPFNECWITMPSPKKGTGPTTVAQRAIFNSYQLTVDTTATTKSVGDYTVTSDPTGIECTQASVANDGTCDEIYAPGTKVILTATPDSNTTFLGWGGPCVGTGTCTVTMNKKLTVIALFAQDPQTLTILKDGDGSGRVKDNLGFINCDPANTDCEGTYPVNQLVKLTAKAITGSHFIKWTDQFHCQEYAPPANVLGPCTVRMNNDLTMTATFGVSTLTVILDGAKEDKNDTLESKDDSVASQPGGIECTNSRVVDYKYMGHCDENYNQGTLVTLFANTHKNSIFTGWSEPSCSMEPISAMHPVLGVGKYPICEVTAATGLTVTASFAERVTLNLSLIGVGVGKVRMSPPGIDCLTNCSEDYAKNISVTLTATADSSSRFVGWNGLGTLCVNQPVCQVPMDLGSSKNDINITAQFDKINKLSVDVMGAGNVTSVPAGINCDSDDPAESEDCFEDYDIIPVGPPFPPPTVVTVTATPDPSSGAAFTGWSGTAVSVGGFCTGSNVCKITMASPAVGFVNRNFTLRATFHVQKKLTVEILGIGDGEVQSDDSGIQCGANCDEDYNEGTTVTLRAITYPGSLFTGWSEETCQTGTTCVVVMDDHKTVTATFKPLSMCVNDVAIDFGGPYGIWARLNNKDWAQIHPLSPDHMAIGDIDGTGVDDLILDFGTPYGLWTLNNYHTWMDLHPLSVEGMITGDLNGDGRDEAIFDFGPGIPNPWVYSKWDEIQNPAFPSGMSVESMVAGDIMGDTTKDDVVFNLGVNGIELWSDHTTWFPIYNDKTPEIMVIGNLIANLNDELVISFQESGIWMRRGAFDWSLVHGLPAKNMVIANMNAQRDYTSPPPTALSPAELIVDFGTRYGIWSWRPNTSNGWMQIHTLSANSMVVADLNCDGNDDLIIDFGSPYGIWTLMGSPNPLADPAEPDFYAPGAIRRWKKLHPFSAEDMATGNIDGIDTPPAPPVAAALDAAPAGLSASDEQALPESKPVESPIAAPPAE